MSGSVWNGCVNFSVSDRNEFDLCSVSVVRVSDEF